ncbi:MAG: hypothetical protein ACRD9Y_21190 [Blastocatellia bacterium]
MKYVESLGIWKVEGSNRWARSSIEATQTWGTARMNAIDLLDDGLNLRAPMIYDEIDEPAGTRRVLNDIETIAAQAKLAEIKIKFVEWLWSSESRARELCAIYNERYNCLRERRYDGSHLQLPGMNSSITLRPHQLDGIARILQSKATLLGHCVGAGKTFLMVAAAMELKRLGLCHKTMAVVPNHLPAQWEAEARRLYPDINVLAPSKEELSASQRGELLSRISTGSWDLIIVPHTAFKMLPVAPDTIVRYIQREIDVLREYLESIPKDERGDSRKTIKGIERAIKKLEVKLKDCESAILRDSKHTITWEELGVDGLFVDECHLYKNLYCPTKMRNVAGLPTADSQRAFDAFIKVRSLLDGGGRVVFATATPVSNTLAEVYVMMKFLQLDTLEEMGIAHFDAWTQLFAETSQGLEMKPDASGFRINTRFNKFTNLPELAALWRQVLDVKNADQLNLPKPKIAGGAPEVITIPASPELKRFVKNLAARVEAIKSRRVPPEVDNMLKITTEGRKAALDIRLVIPGAPRPAAGAHLRQLCFVVARESRSTGRITRLIGRYRGFEIIARASGRQLDALSSLFSETDLFLRASDGEPGYGVNLGESDAGILQSMDAQLRGLEGKLEKSLAAQAGLEHRQRQIDIELNKGFEHAARYEELRLRLDALNRDLTKAGVEIEASPELSNLDEEAFRPVESGVSVHQILSLTEQSVETGEEKAIAVNDQTRSPRNLLGMSLNARLRLRLVFYRRRAI